MGRHGRRATEDEAQVYQTKQTREGRDYFPPQPFIEPELSEQGAPEEESPELGQLAAEAERRVEQS
jgi:hypothetical protein